MGEIGRLAAGLAQHVVRATLAKHDGTGFAAKVSGSFGLVAISWALIVLATTANPRMAAAAAWIILVIAAGDVMLGTGRALATAQVFMAAEIGARIVLWTPATMTQIPIDFVAPVWAATAATIGTSRQ